MTLCWWMWHRNPHACVILSRESFYMCFILLMATYILIAIEMIRAKTFKTGCVTIIHVLQFVQGKTTRILMFPEQEKAGQHTHRCRSKCFLNEQTCSGGFYRHWAKYAATLVKTLQQVWLLSRNHVNVFLYSSELHRCAVFCLLQLGGEIFDTDMVMVDRTLTDICFDNTIVL